MVMKEVEKRVCFEREQEKTSFCVTLRSPPKEHNTYGTFESAIMNDYVMDEYSKNRL